MDSLIPHQGGSRAAEAWRAAALYAALTLLMAYPLPLHPASSAVAGSPDTDLFVWTLAWDAHAFVHQPLSIFDANIFYPKQHTLAYSENLIGSALLVAPFLWFGGNPVLALNLVELLSCVLCGLGAYLLARRLGLGPPGAFVCGLVFAFSPVRFIRIGQLHLTTVEWVPFGLASLHAYLDEGRRRDLRLAAAFFSLQALTSGHGAVFLGVAAVGLVAYRVALGESIAPTRRLRDLGVTGALLLLPAVLGAWPYLRVQEDVGLRRWLVNWAVPASSFLASPAHVQTFLLSFVPSWRIIETAKANLFPGFVPLLLAAVAVGWRLGGRRAAAPPGVWWARAALLLEIATLASLAVGLYVTTFGPVRWKVMGSLLIKVGNTRRAWTAVVIAAGLRAALSRRVPLVVRSRLRCALEAARAWARAHRRDTTTFYLLLTAAAVWLSVGPPIGIWPLVYWLPGFNFIRVPSRFTILAVLGLAVLAGKGFEHLSARLAPRRRVVVTVAVSVLLLGEFAAMPLPTVPYRVETPEVARWLAHQPKPFVVAEVPVTTYERLQSTYMLHSMAHWQKTVNGYSGFRPALHKKLNAELRRFPNRESLERLAGLGVDYVVVHPNLYPPEQWPEVEARLQQFADWLTLAHTGADGRVYTLRRPPDGRP